MKELVRKLRAVMPEQSTINLDDHARRVAEQVYRARKQAIEYKLAAARKEKS